MLVLLAEAVDLYLVQTGIYDHDKFVIRSTSAASYMRAKITLCYAAQSLMEHTVHDLTDTAILAQAQYRCLAIMETRHEYIPVFLIHGQVAGSHAFGLCAV